MVLLGLCALCIVVMRWFPEIALARFLNHALVEQLSRRLSLLKRHHIIFFIVLAAILVMAGDYIMLFASGELVMLCLNLALYLDGVLLASAVATPARTLTAWRGIRSQFPIWWRQIAPWTAREHARPRMRKSKPLDADDEPAGAFTFTV